MTKRQIKTIHLLQIAKSLEAQNDAIGGLLIHITTTADLAARMSAEHLREELEKLRERAEAVRSVIWPDDT